MIRMERRDSVDSGSTGQGQGGDLESVHLVMTRDNVPSRPVAEFEAIAAHVRAHVADRGIPLSQVPSLWRIAGEPQASSAVKREAA